MSPAQCRAGRALIGMEQRALARAAGIAVSTLIDFEAERRSPRAATVATIRAALEKAGVEFTNSVQPGVRLRARG